MFFVLQDTHGRGFMTREPAVAGRCKTTTDVQRARLFQMEIALGTTVATTEQPTTNGSIVCQCSDIPKGVMGSWQIVPVTLQVPTAAPQLGPR